MLYAVLFSVSVLILFAVIYWSTTFYMTDQLDASTNSDATELRQRFEIDGSIGVASEIQDRVGQMPNGPIVYLFQNSAGKALAGNLPARVPTQGPFDFYTRALNVPGADPLTLRGRGELLPNGDYLLVAVDARSLSEIKGLILRAFSWSFAITLVLAFGGGALMSSRVRRRVETVSRTTRAIMAGNLSRRIAVRGVDDEFDHLAMSLNEMLARTESSIEAIRQTSNDIAHDLRTPLARLRHRLELALHKATSADELRMAIDRSIVDTDNILETFSALLRIAQLESGAQRGHFTSVDLSELIWTVIEVYQPIAEEKTQLIIAEIEPGLRIDGDRELLGRMLANLIENAMRHSPEHASIRIKAFSLPNGIDIVIADDGPGIPPEERENVFRRFYRLEASRTTPGSGLGLSLVAAVAAIHAITMTLDDNQPGLRVRLQLPRSD
jgi:signal transduction histidine kinase